MKRSVYIFTLLLFSILSSQIIFAQSKIELKHNKTYKKSKYKNKHIVRKKPIQPREILLRPNKIRKNYLWINGHWKWSWKKNKYIWKKGYWKKKKNSRTWVPGHWKSVPHGFIWVKGYWIK